MISITDKSNCCGCTACIHSCPKHCITMQEDSEGFLYPVVNNEACIDCGLCEKVCPMLHPSEEKCPIRTIAAINKDENTRMQSSSGGIFSLLAEDTITEGGIVFGARFDEQWQVVIDYAVTMEEVRAFMGSKYVQASMGTAYADAKQFLLEGKKVLFSGTPCQIAGLKHFLKKSYDNLLTVDIICHGVPSPKVWSLYLDEVVTAGRKAIGDVQFRNKRNGWKKYGIKLSYTLADNTTSFYCPASKNHYMLAFLSNMILRPSCHNCKAKCGRSHSDITIADFWGIDKAMTEMDDDKGTGLILVNTDKGSKAMSWNKVIYRDTTFELAISHNSAFRNSVAPHPKRMLFFSRLDEGKSIVDLIKRNLRPSFKECMRRCLSLCKRLVLKIMRKNGGVNK